MKRYLRIYGRLLKLNFSALTTYRGNFVNSFISSFVWGIFSIISIVLLTSRTSNIKGWSREEIMFLTATYAVLIGLFHTFFSRNFDRLAHLSHFGELDAILLKPVDCQFLVSCWIVNYMELTRLIIGILLALVLIIQMSWQVTIITLVSYIILLLVGLMLLYSVWLLILTLTVWHTHLSNLVEVMYTISGIGRMPKEIYLELGSFFFFILLPVTLTINTPVQVLLQKITYLEVLVTLVFSFGLFIISRKFWQFALRFYTGASS